MDLQKNNCLTNTRADTRMIIYLLRFRGEEKYCTEREGREGGGGVRSVARGSEKNTNVLP